MKTIIIIIKFILSNVPKKKIFWDNFSQESVWKKWDPIGTIYTEQNRRTISERGFYCKEHAKKSPTRDLCICQKYYDYRVRAEFQPKWALNY